jgi:hypothetical protein
MDRQINEWNKFESQLTNPYNYGQLTYNEGAKTLGKEFSFVKNGAGTTK